MRIMCLSLRIPTLFLPKSNMSQPGLSGAQKPVITPRIIPIISKSSNRPPSLLPQWPSNPLEDMREQIYIFVSVLFFTRLYSHQSSSRHNSWRIMVRTRYLAAISVCSMNQIFALSFILLDRTPHYLFIDHKL